MFLESSRILKPNGLLVLTTPNAGSVDTLINVALMKPPFQFPPHVREYTVGEIAGLANGAGFSVESLETFFAWQLYATETRDAFMRFLRERHFSCEHRGDDIIAVLRKKD